MSTLYGITHSSGSRALALLVYTNSVNAMRLKGRLVTLGSAGVMDI